MSHQERAGQLVGDMMARFIRTGIEESLTGSVDPEERRQVMDQVREVVLLVAAGLEGIPDHSPARQVMEALRQRAGSAGDRWAKELYRAATTIQVEFDLEPMDDEDGDVE